jgi:hypothetical protein
LPLCPSLFCGLLKDRIGDLTTTIMIKWASISKHPSKKDSRIQWLIDISSMVLFLLLLLLLLLLLFSPSGMDQERDGENETKRRRKERENGVCSVPVFLSLFPFSLLLIGWNVRFIYLFIYLL